MTAQQDGDVAEVARLGPGGAVRGVGLGSLAGLFLADSWLLPLAPALSFLEFTTGDLGGKTPTARAPSRGQRQDYARILLESRERRQ